MEYLAPNQISPDILERVGLVFFCLFILFRFSIHIVYFIFCPSFVPHFRAMWAVIIPTVRVDSSSECSWAWSCAAGLLVHPAWRGSLVVISWIQLRKPLSISYFRLHLSMGHNFSSIKYPSPGLWILLLFDLYSSPWNPSSLLGKTKPYLLLPLPPSLHVYLRLSPSSLPGASASQSRGPPRAPNKRNVLPRHALLRGRDTCILWNHWVRVDWNGNGTSWWQCIFQKHPS